MFFFQVSTEKGVLEKTLHEKEAIITKLKQLVVKSKKEATELKNKVSIMLTQISSLK